MTKEDIILYARLLRSIFETIDAIEIARKLGYEVNLEDKDIWFSSATYGYKNVTKAIFISKKYDNISRKILCAHELGHAVLNHNYKDKNLESEYDAALFAVALLFEDSFYVPLVQMSTYELQTILDKNISLLSDEEIAGMLEKEEYAEKVPTDKGIVDPLGNPISEISNIHIEVNEREDWKLNELNKNPTEIYQLSPRGFEEIIAEIYIHKGYKAKVTRATRDGGVDIYITREDDLGSFLFLVQCKKYKPTHKVGVNVLRELYGVVSEKRATSGSVVTTSFFSQPAEEYQKEFQHQMSIRDFDSIKQWLCEVT